MSTWGRVVVKRTGEVPAEIPVIGLTGDEAIERAREIIPGALSYDYEEAEQTWEEVEAEHLRLNLEFLFEE